ncbi:hypothetical protein L486_01220 [Kwoniella mangroviensis CBS 10435]|uniref:Uncharacterized protein n=1 Tax=Kwoniella mangroviensis CBS 10435 TaxID=1331196 RepID=A0A1B9J1B1_9TREE|nr:uncharacterized protein I203_07489 [Kwoniella mangroviensis CBS 8507]OCF61568.1 hypothetical protein L486_01220 [Kwoniella mangroviensis CBS 10435]OCF63421.1 hypothetical protein I203_07489 [Kwoniella mangroviensis CBS 8507]OCF77592.1 hypothetical protein I204_01584 [Kwoniella mangroviensis CBS 8886]
MANHPSLDFLLDGGLIPSLPTNGKVGHQELMGMSMGIKRSTPNFPAQPAIPPNHPVRSPPQPVYGLPYIPNNLPPRVISNQPYTQQVVITRSSSEGKKPNVHGLGHDHYISRTPHRHGKNHSISNILRSQPRPDFQPAHSGQLHEDVSVRRSLSFNQIQIPQSLIPGGEAKLHHSISDSAVHSNSHTHKRSISTSTTHPATYSDNPSSGIYLGSSGDEEVIKHLLDTLNSLIPKERALDNIPDGKGVLNPLNLLIPLSIILEALVNERTILKDESSMVSESKLPLLSDGVSVVLEGGEVNWNILNWYITSFGQLLNGLIPFLTITGDLHNQKQDQEILEDLMRSIKVYITKTKKVFGEIASLYVDRYSFVRGWWDEEGMKGSAGEVGRWAEMFDI